MIAQQPIIEKVFREIVRNIPQIGIDHHKERLVRLAIENEPFSSRSITDLPTLTLSQQAAGLVINAGPSIHKQKILSRIQAENFSGTVLAVDGSYIACLKAGIVPDFVFVLDPHPTRRVRWFGDPDFGTDMEGDDYFIRQDLDTEFRENSVRQNELHIDLVNKYASRTKAIVATTSPRNLVERIANAGFNMYWWNPLVDDPEQPNSITRKLFELNQLPCVNTGGTVGTAAWVFADTIFDISLIGLTGTDFGYYKETPYLETQTYYELVTYLGGLEHLQECFPEYIYPLTNQSFYTDPTYFWYRQNFLELLKNGKNKTYNCSEAGTLFGEDVECIFLDQFFRLL